jgi:hypothetical protein
LNARGAKWLQAPEIRRASPSNKSCSPSQLSTKAALAAAKQRGVRLGRTGAEILAPKYRAEAMARAEQLAPLIRDFQKRGYTLRGIANELEKRKVQTPRGGSWHPQLVKRIMQRLDAGRPPDATWGIRVPPPRHNPTYRYKH